MGTQSVVLNGWRGQVLAGVIMLAIASGASGLLLAARIAFAQDSMQTEVAQVKAKVDKLWEEGIRDESRKAQDQYDHEQQQQIEKKLDALLVRQGLDPNKVVSDK